MTPEMLKVLLDHVVQEGHAAAQRRNRTQAGVWYAQGVSLTRQLGDQAEMMAMLLFYYGEAIAYSPRRPEAIACMEAAARIQKGIGRGEAEADCLYAVGTLMAALGDYSQARRQLGDALHCYRELNIPHKIASTEMELRKATAAYARVRPVTVVYRPIPVLSRLIPGLKGRQIKPGPHNRQLEFAISVDQQVIERFSVSAEGAVEWRQVRQKKRTFAMGLAHVWQVICTNPF